MELPQTLEQAYRLILAQQQEIERMRAQEQDWINLVREFILGDGRKGRKWARTRSRAQSGQR